MNFSNPIYEHISDQERLKEVVEKELKGVDEIAVDVEADQLDPYTANLIFVQIALPKKAFIIDAGLDLSPLKPLLENKKPLKILQNGKFDYGMLKKIKEIEIVNFFDTMLAERILTTGKRRENSLGALALKYLDLELDKDWESFEWTKVARTGRIEKRHLEYAALDVLVLFPIHKKQFAELEKKDLLKVASLEFALAPVVAEMELRGLMVDKRKWLRNINTLKKQRDEVAQKIQTELRPFYKTEAIDLFGNHQDVLNLNSPIQILEAFRKIGLDLPSTGEAILRKTRHPVAKMLLQYRACEKLISAFGENLLAKIHPQTKRIHCDFMQIGADTGRFASSNPNLQQIPADSAFRSAFTASPGYKFVCADYSQIELRIMAELSGDSAFMKAYQEDQDLHTLTASEMYGIPVDKVDKRMRFHAKSINFGLMYGRGAASLGTQLGISVDEAKTLLKKYFKKYHRVKRWLDGIGRMTVKRGYSRTLGGRVRYFEKPDPADADYERRCAYIERQGKNTPIQGSSADMTKYALVFIHKRFKEEGLDAYLVHTVHDEIVAEAKKDIAPYVKELMEEEMVKAGEILLKKVPVKVDVKISDVWEH